MAVFVLLIKDNTVLLLKRANTAWISGYYDAPAGALEPSESLQEGAIRELREETGIKLKPEDLELVHVARSDVDQYPYIDFIFKAKNWSGEPKIMEPEKCTDMKFFNINDLPPKTGPFTKVALKNLKNGGVTISYHAPGTFKE